MEKIKPGRTTSAEEQLAVLHQQLVQAQRLTAIGELTSTVVHEFNNVLTTIINYAKLGLRHKDEATRDKALAKILSAGERAATITNSVLGMARNRSDSFEPTDLTKIIDETLVLLDRELHKYRISVETQIHPTPPANAIGNQIQQVLLNLVINARQAIAEGGRIVVGLSHDAVHDTVDLSVRDTGSGIPADRLPHIFDPFFSTKSRPDRSGKGGTGLGLSTCRTIIEQHRGRIRVESTVGVGTCFTIKLPAYRPASRVPTPSAGAAVQANAASSPGAMLPQ